MKAFTRIVFFIILAELIIGGGGRMFAIGPITLRMVLFVMGLLLSVYWYAQGKRLPKNLLIFLGVFIGGIFLSTSIGFATGADSGLVIQDVKPLLYVLILPFFFFAFEVDKDPNLIARMIIVGALMMSGLFFAILLLIHSSTIPFLSFYNLVIDTEEFFFRAETTFFYKGFIYLCVGLIFVYFTMKRHRGLILIILSLAVILTFTRGFIFALALTFLIYKIHERKLYHALVGGLIVASVLLFSKPIIYQASSLLHSAKQLDETVPKDKLLGNREESDDGRLQQARQVFMAVTPVSLLIGHGFGNGVPARPVHMEVSYLEIFHKQGIVGIAIWTYLLYLLLLFYSRTRKNSYTNAFFYSVLFFFFQSITNQFINNPIGLSFNLLTLVFLYQLSSKNVSEKAALSHQKGDEITVSTL